MTKVEELKEKAEYSLVRDNGEKQSGYHFDTPEKLKAFEQAVREEERDSGRPSESDIRKASNTKCNYLPDYENSPVSDIERRGFVAGCEWVVSFLTQPTKEK